MLTEAQMSDDIKFLLLRAGSAGSCSFSSDRWTGQSSNAIVALAYGGEQTAMPADRADYAACVRTVRRLPAHRRTEVVLEALTKAREAYLSNYPSHRFPAAREAERKRYASEDAEWRRKSRKRKGSL